MSDNIDKIAKEMSLLSGTDDIDNLDEMIKKKSDVILAYLATFATLKNSIMPPEITPIEEGDESGSRKRKRCEDRDDEDFVVGDESSESTGDDSESDFDPSEDEDTDESDDDETANTPQVFNIYNVGGSWFLHACVVLNLVVSTAVAVKVFS